MHLSVKLPSTVLTVITDVPTPPAVTTPLFTVATLVLEEDHVTFLLVASSGAIVATKVAVALGARDKAFVFKETPVTLIVCVGPGSGLTGSVLLLLHPATAKDKTAANKKYFVFIFMSRL